MKKLFILLLLLTAAFALFLYHQTHAILSAPFLRAAYRLEDTNYTDWSGNNNIVTASGTPVTTTTGPFGKSIAFPSGNTSTVITTGTNIGIDGVSTTITAWVGIRTQPALNVGQVIVQQVSSVSKAGYFIQYQDSGGTKSLKWERIKNGVADDQFTFNVTLATTTGAVSTLHHVALTYDGVNVIGFLDGLQKGMASSSGNGTRDDGNHFTIGGTTATGPAGGTCPCVIDEVHVYKNRALTLAEIKADMLGFLPWEGTSF
jgi:Concanavalin A-like lectin/glucanases superfamily